MHASPHAPSTSRARTPARPCPCRLQVYVALSRARSLEGLQVLDCDPSRIKVRMDVPCVAVAGSGSRYS